MRKLKKMIAVVIAATMITSMSQLSLTAFAAEAKTSVAADDAALTGTCGENVTYTFDQTTGTLTISGTGNMNDFTYLENTPWSSIKSSVVNIVIESGVQSIGNYAFSKFSSLKSVSIPNSIDMIGNYAFQYCTSLQYCYIPNSVSEIGEFAFAFCSALQNVRLPASLQHISGSMFTECTSLLSESIPSTVKSIGNGAYRGCESLPNINLPQGLENIGVSAFSNCTQLSEIHIPDSVTEISESAFSDCSNLQIIELPENLQNISDKMFDNCTSLSAIDIPSSVKSIGYGSFSRCSSLPGVTLPQGLEHIGNNAFNGCILFQEVIIPDSVTEIESGVFGNCTNLCKVVLPKDLKSISSSMFEYCESLTTIDIPLSVESIGGYAFYRCESLSDFSLPEGLIHIGDYAFAYCHSFFKIEIPDSVGYIGDNAFSRDYRGTVLRGSIGGTAYYYAENNPVSFESNGTYIKTSGKCGDNVYFDFDGETGTLVISGTGKIYDFNVTNWGSVSDVPFFGYSKSIKKIVIEEGVTGIGSGSLNYSKNLEEIKLPASLEEINRNLLPSSEKGYMIYAVEGTPAYNFAVENWLSINGKVQGLCGYNVHYTFDETTGLLTIGGTGEMYYFNSYSQITPWISNGWNELIKDVVIEEGVTGLGSNTFTNCPNIKSINISATVTDLNAIADPYNNPLESKCFESINVSEENQNYSSIDGVLFNKEKTKLICYPTNKPDENYSVPETVDTIAAYAFSYNDKLVNIDIPDSVTSIENYAFYECQALKNVVLPTSITSIEDSLFFRCTALDNIIIPDGVVSIGRGAFEICTSLRNVVIPNSVTSIGSRAFSGCTSLESIVLSENITEIKANLFDGCISLKDITITDKITSIGNSAFRRCTSLKSVVIPKNVKSIGYDVFVVCDSLKNAVILNDSVKFYGDSVFPKTTTIYGKMGSTAYRYATPSRNEFISIPEIYGYSVSLSGNIGLNYYINVNDSIIDKNPVIKFCYGDKTVIAELGPDDANLLESGKYLFTCPVSASKMGTEIKTYFVINGFEICISEDYSVQKYAEYILANASSNEEYAKAVNIVKAMLNYGAYSEIALLDVASSNTNSALTDEEKTLAEIPDLSEYKYAVSGTSEKVKYSGSLISLKTETVIRHYFAIADGINAEDLTFTVNGQTVAPVKDGKYYRIDIAGVNAKNLDVNYQVKVDGLTLDYSVLSYVNSAINSDSISDSVKASVKALYHYYSEAKNYAV